MITIDQLKLLDGNRRVIEDSVCTASHQGGEILEFSVRRKTWVSGVSDGQRSMLFVEGP